MKCNLDCSYCSTGLYGGHDNSTRHPPVDQCLDTVDFMFSYVDLYMARKPKGIRYVVLNIYGGESLHHPHIVDILEKVHHVWQNQYKCRWHLTVTTTTNAIVSKKKLHKIIPLIDEFTVSYHSENTDERKDLFKSNIQDIRDQGRRIKCVILMHPQPELFQDSQAMIAWCQLNNIKHLPRQLDHVPKVIDFNYYPEQVIWFDRFYKDKSYNVQQHLDLVAKQPRTNLTDVGRACCGGRSLCKDQSYKSRDFYVGNQFPDWYCSVDEFFLYIKQVNGEIYTNKDCMMNFNGKVGPIGNLSDTVSLLATIRTRFNNQGPAIRCKKTQCWCGLCAPKAKHQDTFNNIMEKYRA
jgi:pyruvate-formate lyase-activating enzyme